jgi:hypothetical protein
VSTPDPRDPYRPPSDAGGTPPSSPPPAPGTPPGAPGPPGPGPPPRPARTTAKAPADHPAARAARTALLVAVIGVGMTLVLPPAGLVLDATAVLLGVRARRRARKDALRAPGAATAIVLGASCIALVLAVVTVLGPQLSTYSACMSGANTEIAKQNCRTTLIQELERRYGVDLPQSAG